MFTEQRKQPKGWWHKLNEQALPVISRAGQQLHSIAEYREKPSDEARKEVSQSNSAWEWDTPMASQNIESVRRSQTRQKQLNAKSEDL